jgi:hypothetical protein
LAERVLVAQRDGSLPLRRPREPCLAAGDEHGRDEHDDHDGDLRAGRGGGHVGCPLGRVYDHERHTVLHLARRVTALRDASGLSYLAADLLGTPILTYTCDTAGDAGTQLRAPYGHHHLTPYVTPAHMKTGEWQWTKARDDHRATGEYS